MQRHSAILLLLMSLPAIAAADPPTFPYKAYVNVDGVYVRSGPGNNYYPTDKLDKGAEVEVYRHDPGGWYAIRPPAGSFTWVASRYLQTGKAGLATVSADHVAARVGSRFSDIRDVIQVRLERGEQVEVLETKTISGDSESPSWCKIAPPSGEFRWVFGKFVESADPQSGIRKTSGQSDTRLSQSSALEEASPPTRSMAAGARTPKTAARDLAEDSQAAADNSQPAAMRHLSPEELQAELDRLNLELSTMLVEEPSVWQLSSLAGRGEELLGQAQTALERGRVRLLVNRIHQAEEIKGRYDAIQTAQADAERQSRLLSDLRGIRSTTAESRTGAIAQNRSAAGPGPASAAGSRQVADRRFDGMGRLTRVVPARMGAPQYALVDDKGAVRCYVTPAPGVNLQYYVGRRVGIDGVRGYLPEQKTQHVTAKYVTSLDRPILR